MRHKVSAALAATTSTNLHRDVALQFVEEACRQPESHHNIVHGS